tara:strand:+ start:276 stop:1154 length:879 start_codon:yes stop_codon:yes gene_type:complete
MKKILVTGSEGLIGKVLCEKLEKKFKVVHYDLKRKKNILNKKQLKKDLKGCVGVIHLAGESRVPMGYKYPLKTIKNNIIGTGNILESIRELDSQIWCIYASSREIYGESKIRFREKDLPNPINIYATTKFASELLMRNFGRNYGIDTYVMRFSNVYGGLNDHKDRVIPKFLNQAINNVNITVDGGKQVFDFVHVDDATNGVIRIVNGIISKRLKEKTFLFVTGRGTSIMELAKKIIKITNSDSKIEIRKPRDYDVNHFIGNPSGSKKSLGWKSSIKLEKGLKIYFKEMIKKD